MGRIITRQRSALGFPRHPGDKPEYPVIVDTNHDHARDLRVFVGALPQQSRSQESQVDLLGPTTPVGWSIGIDYNHAGYIESDSREREIKLGNEIRLRPDYVTLLVNWRISGNPSYSKSPFNFSTTIWPVRTMELKLYDSPGNDSCGSVFYNGATADTRAMPRLDGPWGLVNGQDCWLAGTFDGEFGWVHLFNQDGTLVASSSEEVRGGSGFYGPLYYSNPDYLRVGQSWASDSGTHGSGYGLEPGDRFYCGLMWGHAKTVEELQDFIQDPYASLVDPFAMPYRFPPIEKAEQHPLFFGTNF